MIISKFKLLGCYIYKRSRLEESPVKLNLEHYFCDDIGLYAVYFDPNFEYNFVSLTQKKDWDLLALSTFRLSLFNLIATNSIQLVLFEDEKSYFGSFFKRKYKSFYIKILNPIIKGNDKFSEVILKSIEQVNNEQGIKAELKIYIRYINDVFLGKNNEYNRPEKKLIIQLIKYYAKDYNWITIKKEKRLLGIYKDYKVELNKIYIPRLKLHFKELEKYYEDVVKEHDVLRQFAIKLRNALINDFDRRHPKDDNYD